MRSPPLLLSRRRTVGYCALPLLHAVRRSIEAYEKALESLAQTTKKLEVLSRSHVVDAGAKGFVVWLEGILDFLTNGDTAKNITFHTQAELEDINTDAVSHDEVTFRYCTEALIGKVSQQTAPRHPNGTETGN